MPDHDVYTIAVLFAVTIVLTLVLAFLVYLILSELSELGKKAKLKNSLVGIKEYNKSSIRWVKDIGQGQFGMVFQGELRGVDSEVTDVAVKTMKEHLEEDFIREAKLASRFNHPNIVSLIGISVEDLPFYFIFEYMDKGDLADFLRENGGGPKSEILTLEELVGICKQVAAGMDHLAGKKHVHRDLACRNCLVKSAVDENGVIVKIADFGLGRNMYSADYYRMSKDTPLPIRWMSPEAIDYFKFSTQSDVWSFGILMWEVFSFAKVPYSGISNDKVVELVCQNTLLSKPYSGLPDVIYGIMKKCWAMNPDERPSFQELCSHLQFSIEELRRQKRAHSTPPPRLRPTATTYNSDGRSKNCCMQ